MRPIPFLLISFVVLQSALAQTTGPQLEPAEQIPLWANRPTTQLATPERDNGTGRFINVTNPTLFVWLPPASKANGTAIIACPGGAYSHVTMELEGQRIAKWLNPMGIAVFGLKYHTKPPSQDVAADALADGQRAVRLVRSRAAEWLINPNRVGMLGYSAGSNLGLNIASHFDIGRAHGEDPIDLQSCRPNFVVLLSTWPGGPATLDRFPLSADSPMTFIAIAKDDRTAPPPFTALIVQKLQELKVPVKLYEAEKGGHGAFHLDEPNVDKGWIPVFLDWMKQNKLVALR